MYSKDDIPDGIITAGPAPEICQRFPSVCGEVSDFFKNLNHLYYINFSSRLGFPLDHPRKSLSFLNIFLVVGI
jgi:hypothetical protein